MDIHFLNPYICPGLAPASAAATAAFGITALGVEADCGQSDDFAKLGKGGGCVRDRVCSDEMFLEPRLDRGFDLVDPVHRVFDLGPRGAAAERDAGAGTGGIACTG